ncbi:hypothetical protein HELRODRAFT_166713 [Helobdella robusta]|uniref:Uncharacterized protein n=1 Tax=Helobdella robusta TaxID=6412 RepID=T1EYE9_HELRO|nr:hypothetical protein HELRODRAFT_166713 [Helobdella robusta]ESO11698.1 hypothetical protein HELRODRAFT_166713 [Helobdella robusta]
MTSSVTSSWFHFPADVSIMSLEIEAEAGYLLYVGGRKFHLARVKVCGCNNTFYIINIFLLYLSFHMSEKYFGSKMLELKKKTTKKYIASEQMLEDLSMLQAFAHEININRAK